ncbi:MULTISPECIES: MobA/MobL family protein [Stenotrophomonas]|uniref:MobA/MobL family protein n=1 Tax=Stenotrophomonas lactitubi TaxID=2045214 RepID=A0AAW4GIW5_9GAMM|nr:MULTISPECIES: MobA/MobL family protein [Stenotrophomonas]MBM9913876.1 MobA/MobL family protein [Stenotrophomonas lactitubi]MBM9921869.1 MobA/MobL family protein [Stenotrophomonas lactitubi]MBM9938959.1 MobA/MobL family protein [Stenotrophomonas lactitubi]
MAIYHANVKTFSRAKGHSSVAAAAYRAGLLLEDTRTGQRHDYRRRDGVVESRCIIPDDAPGWALVPASLWTEAEAAERRKDSTIAREFEFALPHELDDDQRSSLALAVARALVDRYGFAAQASIHSPGSKGGMNWHVHILATTRRLGPDGFLDKTRELDGGPAGRAEVEWIRELVAATTNAHLEAANLDVRVDHRSLKAQADDALARGDLVAAAVLSRAPTRHLGKDASAIERRGEYSELGERNRSIQEANENAFNEVLAQFEQKSRVMPVPEGHSEAQAQREAKRSSLSQMLAFSDGQIVVSHGLRKAIGERRSDGSTEDVPSETPSVEAIRMEVVRQGDALRDELAAHALHSTLKAVSALASGEVVPEECKEHRSALNALLLGLKRFGAALVRFPKRLKAVRRAIRLRHMAEQAWEDFVANHPEPGVSWTAREWARRRGRRLAALEQRSAELASAQSAATPEQEAILAEDLRLREECLETASVAVLERCSARAEPTREAQSDFQEWPVASDASKPSATPRRPRLH